MNISKELFNSFIFLIPILVGIIFFNRYIFDDSNLIFFICFLIICLFSRSILKIELKLFINRNTLLLFLLLVYFYFRFDDTNIVSKLPINDILNIIIYLVIFILGSIISYNTKKIPVFFWLLTSCYFLMLVINNIVQLEETQSGSHLGVGIVFFTIIPFILVSPERYRKLVFFSLFLIIFPFLAIIGSRGAILAFIGLFVFIKFYRFFSTSKTVYSLTFVILLIFIGCFYYFYLNYADYEQVSMVTDDSIFRVLEKRVGTRLGVWSHCLHFIAEMPFIGHGTNMSTGLQSPSTSENLIYLSRDNISSHSTYIELLYRSGIIGLCIFLIFNYNLWMSFYSYQHIYEIRIASGLLVGILILCITSTVMILNVLELWWGFSWFYLGFAYGMKRKISKSERFIFKKDYV